MATHHIAAAENDLQDASARINESFHVDGEAHKRENSEEKDKHDRLAHKLKVRCKKHRRIHV